MDYMKSIRQVLEEISGIKNPDIEFSSIDSFGDYSTNIALKNKDIDPNDIALKVNNLNLDYTAEVKGKFVNFWLKNDALVDNLIQIDKDKDSYGKSNIGKNKTVIIDYSSPNIAKPFSIGHLRSTVIGQAIYNLFKSLGYQVIGDNHLGDWGTQFGKLLYMIDFKKTKDFSIENLEELYVEFHKLEKTDETLGERAREWFKKLEDGDSTARTVWKQCVNVSLNEFKRIYDLLDIKVDNTYGESFYEEEMKEMLKDPSINKHIVDGEDGDSKVINLESVGIKTPLMFLKGDGATTYATRDLATLRFRQKKYKPDIIVYEVGAEQKLHFKQVFEAAKMLDLIDKDVELVHTAHGLYLAEDGKKFSTRKGKTIKLEEVLDEAIERAKELGNNKEVAKQVGIGAIKYFDLMHSVQSDVVFDWNKILNMNGNSGPYIQYTVARINSVVSKSDKNNLNLKDLQTKNLEVEEILLLRKLSQFQEVMVTAGKTYSPNILCNYLYELSSKFNTFYNAHKIVGGKNEYFKILLTSGVCVVLKNGLEILGIDTPEKM
ncbi:MAG: arginine--tRNA ligase [bacterium]|nr:MAG: arginine--tRNA ligase [bacterium]